MVKKWYFVVSVTVTLGVRICSSASLTNERSDALRQDVCESREPAVSDGGTEGRRVDPLRLFGSVAVERGRDQQPTVVFLGSDSRTLCALNVTGENYNLLWAAPLLSSRVNNTAIANIVGEPSLLRVTKHTVSIVFVYSKNNSYNERVVRIGLAQHSLMSGKELGRIWFSGSCQDAGGPRELLSTLSGKDYLASEKEKIRLRSGLGNFLWSESLRGGDYVEVNIGGSGIFGGAGWELRRVDEVLEADDDRNTVGQKLARVGRDWHVVALPPQERYEEIYEEGTLNSGFPASAQQCGTSIEFSDTPLAMVTISSEDAFDKSGERVVVYLQRLPGLAPLVVAFDFGVDALGDPVSDIRNEVSSDIDWTKNEKVRSRVAWASRLEGCRVPDLPELFVASDYHDGFHSNRMKENGITSGTTSGQAHLQQQRSIEHVQGYRMQREHRRRRMVFVSCNLPRGPKEVTNSGGGFASKEGDEGGAWRRSTVDGVQRIWALDSTRRGRAEWALDLPRASSRHALPIARRSFQSSPSVLRAPYAAVLLMPLLPENEADPTVRPLEIRRQSSNASLKRSKLESQLSEIDEPYPIPLLATRRGRLFGGVLTLPTAAHPKAAGAAVQAVRIARSQAARTLSLMLNDQDDDQNFEEALMVWLEDRRTLVLVERSSRGNGTGHTSNGHEDNEFEDDEYTARPLLVADAHRTTGATCLPGSAGSTKHMPCAWIEVPQRTQFGPTCGLHALSMVLNFWRLHSAYRCSTSSSTENSPTRHVYHRRFRGINGCVAPQVGDEISPTEPDRASSIATEDQNATHLGAPPPGTLLAAARERGYTALGEMFNGTQLAALAAGLGGYRAAIWSGNKHSKGNQGTIRDEVIEHGSACDVKRLLLSGRPILAPFDVGSDGNPTRFASGEKAHYAVLVGLATLPENRTFATSGIVPSSSQGSSQQSNKSDDATAKKTDFPCVDKEEDNARLIVLARHSWNLRTVHIWPWRDFRAAWTNLHATSFYGNVSLNTNTEHKKKERTIPASLYTNGREGIPIPGRMNLPPSRRGSDQGLASTFESLSGLLIEVVPDSLGLLDGGTEVFDEGPYDIRT